jgi:hypothetical protein
MTTQYVKVARSMMTPQGVEFPIPLNSGGEAQIWDIKTWTRYHTYVEQNPQVRGTAHYPWMYIEDITPPSDDLANYVLLPEKTEGREFKKVNQTK